MQVIIQCNVHQIVLQIHLFMENYVFIIVQIIILWIKLTKNVLYHQIKGQSSSAIVYLSTVEDSQIVKNGNRGSLTQA